MTTMVEKVARRMWFEYVEMVGFPNGLMTWDEMISTGDKDRVVFEYRSLARAAVEAMKEPSLEMLSEEICNQLERDMDHMTTMGSLNMAYISMIDAALKEEAQ